MMITIVVTGRYVSFGAVRKSQVYRNLASKNGNAGTNSQVCRNNGGSLRNSQVYWNLALRNGSFGTNSQVHRSIVKTNWRFSK
jgi:hypothetical protein